MNAHSPEKPSPLALAAQYLGVLRRHWRLVILGAAAIFALAAAAILMMPDVYLATTTIMVDPQHIPDKYVSTTVVDDPNDRLNLLTQEVMSNTRLSAVIDELHLYPKILLRQGRDAAVEAMRAHITIQTKHSTGSGPSAFTLSFEAGDARTAARTANLLTETFIRKHLLTRQERVEGTTAFLADELAQTREHLQQQEARIGAYRMEHLGEMPEQMQANLQALAQLQVEAQSVADRLNHIEEERVLLERTPEALPNAPPAPSQRTLLAAQLAQAQAQLTDLLSRYTEEHPDVLAARARVEELRAQLHAAPQPAEEARVKDTATETRLDLLNGERERLLARQSVLAGKMATYQALVDAVPRRQEELSNITRDYETEKEHYRSLLDKTYSAQMATALENKQQGERFEVLDTAKPPDKPVRPNRPRYLAGAGLVSLLAGFGLALLRESTDATVKTQAELQRLLHSAGVDAELLGALPSISAAQPLLRRVAWHSTERFPA